MPFGEYKDFSQCVQSNQDKSNPEAYCAAVHKKITGEWPSQKNRIEALKGNFKEKSLNELKVAIKQEIPYIDKKPYSHNIISLTLQQIAKEYGKEEANKVIRDLKLDRFGWRAEKFQNIKNLLLRESKFKIGDEVTIKVAGNKKGIVKKVSGDVVTVSYDSNGVTRVDTYYDQDLSKEGAPQRIEVEDDSIFQRIEKIKSSLKR